MCSVLYVPKPIVLSCILGVFKIDLFLLISGFFSGSSGSSLLCVVFL